MVTQISIVVQQIRLQQWAEQICDCQSRRREWMYINNRMKMAK